MGTSAENQPKLILSHDFTQMQTELYSNLKIRKS